MLFDMSKRVVIKDKGWKEIKKRFPELDGAGVKVGVTADAGSYTGGVSLALVAAVLHYGRDGSVKKWPFIRNGIAKGKSKLDKLRIDLIKQYITNSASLDTLLNKLGLLGKSLIQKEIKTVTSPALSETTTLRKKSTKPLIDTGQLLNSIDYEVKK